MKLLLSWLKDYLKTTASLDEIVATMTMAGLEVEHVFDTAKNLEAFHVAKIMEARPHPNADRLQVCEVETAFGLKEVVCGAPNARKGLVTIYAPIGTYVPGLDIHLKERAVRGVVSQGMLCSASELSLGQDSDGILDLPADYAVGTKATEVFGFDPVIDFEVTPNRSDWLGVVGVARDLGATGIGEFRPPASLKVEEHFPCPIAVEIEADQACPYFAGRLIRGVRNGPSPEALQKRLKAIGLRSINALVDVTNYLCQDRARPLHVYDAKKLYGPQQSGSKILVRLGKKTEGVEESFTALDGKTYSVSKDMCVVATPEKILGLGGVMGGLESGSTEDTTDVFIEAALFNPSLIAETGRTLGLYSDSQYRFARGVDPGAVLEGLNQATRMILEICGGEASEIVVAGRLPEPPAPIRFDPNSVARLTGLDPRIEAIKDSLEKLGFSIDDLLKDQWIVTPPTWRYDVTLEADLVEEVARLIGYDALPSLPLPQLAPDRASPSPKAWDNGVYQPRSRLCRHFLATSGFSETIGWSFISEAEAQAFGGGEADLQLANPIASDLSHMRPSLLPGLLSALGRNTARGFPDAALFELGPIFLGQKPEDQKTALAAVLSSHPPRYWEPVTQDPLYQIKSDLMALLDLLGLPASALSLNQGQIQEQAVNVWHPGQSAFVQLGPKTRIAVFGALHPKVLKMFDLASPVYGFELWLDQVPRPKSQKDQARGVLHLSPLMPVHRDFAFVVSQDTPAGDLVRAAYLADKGLIDDVFVFDVYEGEKIADNMKSVAISVRFQPRDQSLTEENIDALSQKVIDSVSKACEARLRL